MLIFRQPTLLAIGLAFSINAAAQVTDTATYDPSQLPAFKGQVAQFTLTPRGDIDGVILKDGTEVKTPPHLSTSVAYAIKPGDTVTIHGLHAAALPLIQAVSITDAGSGRTVVDNGPVGPGGAGGPPERGPRAPRPMSVGAPLSQTQGQVQMTLHGARGEVNGALLKDGTVLRFNPDAAGGVAGLLVAGNSVVAQGVTTSNSIGKVVDVEAIGATNEQLVPLAGAQPPGGLRPPPGPRPPPTAPRQ